MEDNTLDRSVMPGLSGVAGSSWIVECRKFEALGENVGHFFWRI